MKQAIIRLGQFFSPEHMVQYFTGKLLPNLVVAAIIFAAFYLFWRIANRGLGAFMKRSRLDLTAQRFIQTVVKYIVLTIGVVTSLNQLGVQTASILTSLGVAGLTIGFAAKDALSNIISGIFIFWDRPFVIGDLVEVSGQYGKVEEITMRSTRVVTNDGKMLAIPNSEVVNTTVASYTNFPHLRIDVTVTVGLSENLSSVRRILVGLVEKDERFMTEPAPEIVVKTLNDYNVEVELRAWLEDERKHIPVRFELREKIFNALNIEGVEMPFETLQVSMLEPRAS